MQAQQKQERTIGEAIKNNYAKIGQIRVTFRFEGGHVLNAEKIEMFFEPDDKLLEVKTKIDALTDKNLYLFLNQSFMPSFDARVGDLALCYGKMDEGTRKHEIRFIACQQNERYG